MSIFYIKKGDRFLDRSGRPMTYGIPMKFGSQRDALRWIREQKNPEQYHAVFVREGTPE